ncbi:MAG: pyridine nucleotide-disulfide oxidoreductase [Geminicoccaceae bacterium]|nr:MAG: pyridine nucleotide-disulfide oxidoreductase [Geminicoccaceae bacterium]
MQWLPKVRPFAARLRPPVERRPAERAVVGGSAHGILARSALMAAPHILLVGGGHAHALLLHHWAAKGGPPGPVTLVSPEDHSPYSGMLPGYVAGHYGFGAFHVDLVGLTERARVQRVRDRVVGLDLPGRQVLLADGGALSFDWLSLDTGSTSGLLPLPGAAVHTMPVKPLQPFLTRLSSFLRGPAVADPAPSVVVLGGGLGGIELALALQHRLDELRPQGTKGRVTLVERQPTLAPQLDAKVARKLARWVQAAGVEIRTCADVVAFTARGVELRDGTFLASDFTLTAVGARPAPWLQQTGLALDPGGFVRVDSHLTSVSHDRVLAVGDVAHMDASPREKAGVFAVRQGPVLAAILEARLRGRPVPAFEPQADYLRLVSLGAKRALGLKYGRVVGGLGLGGAIMWRLKDRIDRRFMATVGTVDVRSPSKEGHAKVPPGSVREG